MYQIHCIVEVPEYNCPASGFECKQVLEVLQIGDMQHKIIDPGVADFLVELLGQDVEGKVGRGGDPENVTGSLKILKKISVWC